MEHQYWIQSPIRINKFVEGLLKLGTIFLVTIGGYENWISSTFLGVSAQVVGSKRRNANVDGDIIIGALFPMHKQPSMKVAFTRQCGPIWEQYGIHRIEIFLKTLDEINDNHGILPNVTLGCDIRDSCWYPPVALEQSIDFIKNSIASLEAKLANKTGQQTGCGQKRNKPIAGLIGPGSSTVTVQVQNLLSLFNIPQIGYSATTQDLSDKSLYKYFLRVVPSDKLQARALLDIVLHYNWTYVSTVYTEGNYGSSGMEQFQDMLKGTTICEASTDKVPNNADNEAYDNVIDTLLSTPNARVVVCFCEGMTIRGLLMATERRGVKGHFLFIGSDGWNVRPDVVEDIEDLAAGGISIKLYSPDIHDFDDYFFALNPFNNTRNPWFAEFWQEKFECYIEGDSKLPQFNSPCTGGGVNESLEVNYIPDAKLGFVVNAIYTIAYALDSMRKDLCGDMVGLCEAMKPINGSTFLSYLFNVSFESYSKDMIHFNENGDPPGRYDLMNFQPIRTENGTLHYDYVRVGGWDQGNLTMSDTLLHWPGSSNHGVVDSVCSKPCPHGQVKKINDGGIQCCWVCTPCSGNSYLMDEYTCKECQLGWKPNEQLTACNEIQIEFMQWGDTEAIVSMVFACTGIFVTGWVALVFIRHNNTAVVKASTRELSYIILVGICISFLTTFPLVAKPSLVTCYLARILPGLSFSLIYGALVTKTNRIARILAGSKKKIMTRKPRFMSASAQVVITCIIIGIECAIITVMLILEPADSKLIYPTKTQVKLACNATTMGIIVPLGFDIFLIVMCTLYAIKTRNLPENFNEAKFIGFTMYTTCVIWVAFVPIYFGSDNKVITMCMAITLSATVALILLFFPKIYIIVCKPEKNNRSAFTTSKDVRCHIGSTSRSYQSVDSMSNRGPSSYQWRVHHEPPSAHSNKIVSEKQMEVMWNEKSFENAALTIYRQRNFFDRWRQKSVSAEVPSSQQPQISTKQSVWGKVHNTSGIPLSSNGSLSPQDTATHNPVARIVEARRIRAPAPFANFKDLDDMECEFEVMNTVIDNHDLSLCKSDCGVQTGEELLESLIGGLRRRKVSYESQGSLSTKSGKSLAISTGYNSASNSNHRESPNTNFTNNHSRIKESNQTIGNPSMVIYDNHNKLSDPSTIIKNHGATSLTSNANTVPSVTFSDDKHLIDTNKYTDSIANNCFNRGANEHLSQHVCVSGSNHDASDSCPLLLSDNTVDCDSTSEDTLSERDPFVDIEDLLIDVEPHKGSFGTLKEGSKSSRISLSDTTGDTALYKPENKTHEGVLMDKVVAVGYSSASPSLPHKELLSRRASSPSQHTQNSYRIANSQHRGSFGDTSWIGPSNSNKMPIPSILVERASQSSSDWTPCSMSVDSSRPSGEIEDDSRRPSLLSCDNHADRTSAEVSSIEDFSMYSINRSDSSGTDHSVFEKSGTEKYPGGKKDSVTEFQEYLQTKGLQLDLNSVQSSEV